MTGERRPALEAFTPRERRVVRQLRTPRAVQAYLREFPYNWRETLRTFRGVVAHGSAHCLEAVLFAATILEQHGYPPLVLDLESQDGLDHVLFLYQGRDGRWGTVARSRDEGLHGRQPVFRTIRALVDTYMDPYVDGEGRLVGYGTTHLDAIVSTDWRLDRRNLWSVERALIRMPHVKVHMGERRYATALRRFRAFKARHPVPSGNDWRQHLRAQSRAWL